MEYKQLVRRHEKTLKVNGEKQDMPTSEGFAMAYERGMKLREDYGKDVIIRGRCSDPYRTHAAARAWLTGAGVREQEIKTKSELNPPNFTKEQFKQIRNEPDKSKKLSMLYNDFREKTTQAGLRVAQYLVASAQQQMEKEDQITVVDVGVINAPQQKAAEQLLKGRGVSYEKIMEDGGIFPVGEGFDFQVRKEGSLYVAEITAGDKKEELELDEIIARIER